MFLIATVTALLTVLLADTLPKRRAHLCQQEHRRYIEKPR